MNHRKADRTPEEAGLRLRARPVAPRAVPATRSIRNAHGIPDWQPFVAERKDE